MTTTTGVGEGDEVEAAGDAEEAAGDVEVVVVTDAEAAGDVVELESDVDVFDGEVDDVVDGDVELHSQGGRELVSDVIIAIIIQHQNLLLNSKSAVHSSHANSRVDAACS